MKTTQNKPKHNPSNSVIKKTRSVNKSRPSVNKNDNKKQTINTLLTLGHLLDGYQKDIVWRMLTNPVTFWSGPRQIGKTECVVAVANRDALAGRRVLYTAHRKDLANSVMRRMKTLCEPLQEAGVVTNIINHQQGLSIEYASGGFVMFRTRADGVGVGQTFDTIIWDEATKVTSETVEELTPTIITSPSPRQVWISSPPTEDDLRLAPGNTFVAARYNKDPNFIEHSAVEEYHPTLKLTIELARKANPAWRRLPNYITNLRGFSSSMSHREFWRQYMGVWDAQVSTDNQVEPFFTAQEVANMLTVKGSRARRFEAAVGVLPDSRYGYIVMGDGLVSEVVYKVDIEVDGLDGFVDWLSSRILSLDYIHIPANSRGTALAGLMKKKRLDKKINMIKMPDLTNNIVRFIKQVNGGQLKIFKAQETVLALSSFWFGFDSKSGNQMPEASISSDKALVLALINCCRDKVIKTPSGDTVSKSNDNTPKKSSYRW